MRIEAFVSATDDGVVWPSTSPRDLSRAPRGRETRVLAFDSATGRAPPSRADRTDRPQRQMQHSPRAVRGRSDPRSSAVAACALKPDRGGQLLQAGWPAPVRRLGRHGRPRPRGGWWVSGGAKPHRGDTTLANRTTMWRGGKRPPGFEGIAGAARTATARRVRLSWLPRVLVARRNSALASSRRSWRRIPIVAVVEVADRRSSLLSSRPCQPRYRPAISAGASGSATHQPREGARQAGGDQVGSRRGVA